MEPRQNRVAKITRVIVDKASPETAIDEANKRIKEIYDRLTVK